MVNRSPARKFSARWFRDLWHEAYRRETDKSLEALSRAQSEVYHEWERERLNERDGSGDGR
jgi:hypothetical protein